VYQLHLHPATRDYRAQLNTSGFLELFNSGGINERTLARPSLDGMIKTLGMGAGAKSDIKWLFRQSKDVRKYG
jgi:hypothetical protein